MQSLRSSFSLLRRNPASFLLEIPSSVSLPSTASVERKGKDLALEEMFQTWVKVLLACALCALQSSSTTAFIIADRVPLVSSLVATPKSLVPCSAKSDNGDQVKTDNPVTKGAWYAVEAFGKVFGKRASEESGGSNEESSLAYPTDSPPQSVEETMARIKVDNEKEYFLSGSIDRLIYDEQCEFADPFVSFKGRDRFIDNLENLGSFITQYSARPLSYEESDNAVDTKFMVKLELNLPWKPVLAWPWGVRCQIDPTTKLIVLHKESWDVEALEGVKQIFRKPTTSVK